MNVIFQYYKFEFVVLMNVTFKLICEYRKKKSNFSKEI